MDEMEQMIKEKLLQGLIEKMSDANGSRMRPKGLAVQVAAPDKEHLESGLEDAKSILGGKSSEESSESPSEEEDEQRLMALLSEDDDEDDKKKGY